MFKDVSPSDRVYLDHNATTPLCSDLYQQIPHWLQHWGNPSSIHWMGRGPKQLLRESRQKLAQFFGVHPLELVVTSGGSESNNTVIKGVYEHLRFSNQALEQGRPAPRNKYIFSTVEHPSVMKTAQWLARHGQEVHFIPVDREGNLDEAAFDQVLDQRTALVSIMMANNETGHIFDIKKLAQKAHAVGALFHTDGVQALGKLSIDLTDLGVDYASFAGHKFYALKGAGLIFVKRGSPLVSLIDGGAQERNRRGGTENLLALTSLAFMTRLKPELPNYFAQMETLRNHLESEMMRLIPDIKITGASGKRLVNTSSLVIEGVDGESLLMNLDMRGFAVSTGAACSSGSPEPSPVLLAMGLSREEAQSSLRIGLGFSTTREQIDRFVSTLKEVVQHLRSVSLPQERRVNELNEERFNN